MDRRSDLIAAPVPAGAGFEQAIFTSILSPVARGYRIVSASPGVTEDEKRELIQRCPSHGALLDSGPDASGGAWLTLRGGRQCLWLSRHAGPEPSGRGGLRVHSHALIGEPELFARFAAMPLALADTYHDDIEAVVARPPEHCPRLPAPQAELIAHPSATFAEGLKIDLLLTLVNALLCDNRTIVLNDPHPEQTLAAVLALTPLAVRLRRSAGWGMRFGTQRCFTLMFLDADSEPIERIATDHQCAVLDWSAPTRPDDSEYLDWISFIENGWELDRDGIVSLAERMACEGEPAAISRVITLWWEVSRLERLDLPGLERTLERESRRPSGGAALDLWNELHERGQVRRRELAAEQERREAERAAQEAAERLASEPQAE